MRHSSTSTFSFYNNGMEVEVVGSRPTGCVYPTNQKKKFGEML